MDEAPYDEFLRTTWEAHKKEEIDWVEQGRDEDSEYENGRPSARKVDIIICLRKQTGLGLKEANAIVLDFLARHPDPDYEEWSLRQREKWASQQEAINKVSAQSGLNQEQERKWWQFWR